MLGDDVADNANDDACNGSTNTPADLFRREEIEESLPDANDAGDEIEDNNEPGEDGNTDAVSSCIL